MPRHPPCALPAPSLRLGAFCRFGIPSGAVELHARTRGGGLWLSYCSENIQAENLKKTHMDEKHRNS